MSNFPYDRNRPPMVAMNFRLRVDQVLHLTKMADELTRKGPVPVDRSAVLRMAIDEQIARNSKSK